MRKMERQAGKGLNRQGGGIWVMSPSSGRDSSSVCPGERLSRSPRVSVVGLCSSELLVIRCSSCSVSSSHGVVVSTQEINATSLKKSYMRTRKRVYPPSKFAKSLIAPVCPDHRPQIGYSMPPSLFYADCHPSSSRIIIHLSPSTPFFPSRLTKDK